MKAAVTTGRNDHNIVEIREIDIPKPGPNDILVKVMAAAANPTDWKTSTIWYPKEGNVLGCDYAGIIEAYGSSPNGAQAEYVVAPSVGALLIPDSWSFEEASQLSAGSFTACQMLYYALPLPMPSFSTSTSTPNPQPQTDVLIWGGSSSVGQAAVQLAHLSGLRVISTSSPRNFSLVKSLGADIVLPHSDPETISKIRALTGNKLKYALDTISEGSTPQQVADCIGDEGGVVSTALLYDSPRKDVEVRFVLAGMLMGIDLEVPFVRKADPEQHEFAKKASKLLTELLAKGLYKPGRIRVMPKGLASVNEGLELLRDGKVSGEKIVYRISDTP
ncbi:zinc-binding oxidoreductase [Pyrrhoderma noxium]|uniref:Zinc-binding oxidoreductase n=1 Tax=Pyrrhoderma noxium TaxID=2282107 RepID=A0A286U7I2_9AGAM|nr:zinc-binding oxidoreductase [Pyrrhoderma noxium]